MHATDVTPGRGRQAAADGFTLVEVLVAIVVLIFGIIAITNLFVVAGSSNVVARHMTAAAAEATEVMELIKATPFTGLVPGGAIDLDDDALLTVDETVPVVIDTGGDGTIDVWGVDRSVDGVGTIRTRWQVISIDNQTRLIKVVAGSTSPLLRRRSRVELTAYRSCTAGANLGCADAP